MSYCVILRGPLGIGKTTIAAALSERLKAQTISIDQILEEHRLEEWEGDSIAPRSFLRANEVAASEALPFLRQEVPVIFDGNFYYQSQLDDLTERIKYRSYVFSLEAPLSVCVERDRLRPVPPPDREPRAGDQLGEEATRTVYAMVARVRCGIPIDAAGTVDSIVTKILSRLPTRGNPSTG